MFRSSVRSSTGISSLTSLLMLLMLKFLKYLKYFAIHHFNISNINREVNKEISEDDLIVDRNMLDYFLKVF